MSFEEPLVKKTGPRKVTGVGTMKPPYVPKKAVPLGSSECGLSCSSSPARLKRRFLILVHGRTDAPSGPEEAPRQKVNPAAGLF